MPHRGWVTLSVREDVRRRLDELASKLGMSSPNDVIAFLLSRYEELTEISVKLEKLLTDISVKLDRLLTDRSVSTPPSLTDISVSTPGNLTDKSVSPSPSLTDKSVNNPPSLTDASVNPTGGSSAQQKPRRTAWEILEERGVSCMSEMKVKDPGSVMDKLVERGAYVVSWDKDRCAILPEVYEGLLKLIPEVKVSDPERVATLLKARDSRYARVFRVLYKAGALYYDREKGWQVDEEFVEKGGETG
jgi:hypothetical protein